LRIQFFYLPAIPAATEVTLTAAASALVEASIRTLSAFCRSRLIDHKCSTHQLAAIECLNCLRCGVVVVDFDKPESAGFAAEPVTHDIHTIDLYARFVEERLDIGLRRFIRQVPYEQSRHFALLNRPETAARSQGSKSFTAFGAEKSPADDVFRDASFLQKDRTLEEPYQPKTDNSIRQLYGRTNADNHTIPGLSTRDFC
jgi:hypothetical protein